MTENVRLRSILEKQDAADRAHVAELARQAMADHLAKEARDRVLREWQHLYRVLTQTAATANAAMTGGRKLYLQPYNPNAVRTVGDAIITFEDKYSEDVEQKCVVGVQLNGMVSVSIRPEHKEYQFDIWTASMDQLEGIVYDFMELNIKSS